MAEVSALDQPGNVGDHERLIVIVGDDSEIRLEGGKGIVGDLGSCRRDARDQGGLSGVRKANQSDIGEKLQLQSKFFLFARQSVLGAAGRAVYRRCKVSVPMTAAAPGRDQHALARLGEIVKQFAGFKVVDYRSERDSDFQILAILSMPVAAFAMAAAARTKDMLVTKLQESVVLVAGDDVDAAAVPAVSATRPAPGNEFFPPEGDASVATVSSTHGDLGFVDEHREMLERNCRACRSLTRPFGPPSPGGRGTRSYS